MRQDGAFGTSFPARRTSLDAKPEETAAAKYLKFDFARRRAVIFSPSLNCDVPKGVGRLTRCRTSRQTTVIVARTPHPPYFTNLIKEERRHWALNPAKDEFIFSVADWYHCRLIYEPKARLARVSAGCVALSSHAGISAEGRNVDRIV